MATENKPVLVVMAAGLGSRFKGLKQIQTVDDDGHILMDYAIYDALEAGFGEIVFIIREEFEDKFKKAIGNRIAEKTKVTYVYQSLEDVPADVEIPADRVKPWGTTHALWSARKALKGKKFLTINADDFYGRGYYTEDGGISYHLIPSGAYASMNLWAFSEGFIDDIEVSFAKRFEDGVKTYPDTFEETISDAVQSILSREKGEVTCIPTDEAWFGMTYVEELGTVKNSLKKLREDGVYVSEKW